MVENQSQRDIEPFLLNERICETNERLDNYEIKRMGKLCNSTGRPRKYAACSSVIRGLLNEDLRRKTIIEVGPGLEGRFMLDLISEEGGIAIGIDRIPQETEGSEEDIKILTLAMEDLGKAMPQKIDLINVMYMDYFPWGHKIQHESNLGSFFERIRARRHIQKYDYLVADSFAKTLKPNGFITHWWMPGGSYRLNPKAFVKNGFAHREFDLFTKLIGYNLDIYQKQ